MSRGFLPVDIAHHCEMMTSHDVSEPRHNKDWRWPTNKDAVQWHLHWLFDYLLSISRLKGLLECLLLRSLAMVESVASSITLDSAINVDKVFIFSNMPPTTDRISGALRDELRRVVALYCMEVIYRKDPMKVNAMRSLMFDLFHGNSNKNIISHVDMLCRGGNIFSDLFEDRHDNIR